MRTILIRYDSFHVVLDADALGEIPRANFRKLLKLAYRDSRNEATLRELGSILEENAANSAAAHAKAKEAFTVGWKYVNQRSRSKTAMEIQRENNRLQNAVKRTKAELNLAKSLLKIFNEMEIIKNGSSNNQ